jgi:hypothetical protein
MRGWDHVGLGRSSRGREEEMLSGVAVTKEEISLEERRCCLRRGDVV